MMEVIVRVPANLEGALSDPNKCSAWRCGGERSIVRKGGVKGLLTGSWQGEISTEGPVEPREDWLHA